MLIARQRFLALAVETEWYQFFTDNTFERDLTGEEERS